MGNGLSPPMWQPPTDPFWNPRMRRRIAAPGVPVLHLEADVGEGVARTCLNPEVGTFPQILQQFGRQIVLQQVDFAAQQFQYPHGGIADLFEQHMLLIRSAHQFQSSGVAPRIKAERSAAERPAMV